MNPSRVVLGGIVAGIICFIGDGVVHGVLLQSKWMEIASTLHLPSGGSGFEYFVPYDLLKGIGTVFLYAAIRPRFGAGPRTALLAGLITSALCLALPLLGLLPIHFFGRMFALLWTIYGAVPVVLGGLAGAALYREG